MNLPRGLADLVESIVSAVFIDCSQDMATTWLVLLDLTVSLRFYLWCSPPVWVAESSPEWDCSKHLPWRSKAAACAQASQALQWQLDLYGGHGAVFSSLAPAFEHCNRQAGAGCLRH